MLRPLGPPFENLCSEMYLQINVSLSMPLPFCHALWFYQGLRTRPCSCHGDHWRFGEREPGDHCPDIHPRRRRPFSALKVEDKRRDSVLPWERDIGQKRKEGRKEGRKKRKKEKKRKNSILCGNEGTRFASFHLPFKIILTKQSLTTSSGAETMNQKLSRLWEKLFLCMVPENRLIQNSPLRPGPI